MVDVSNAVLTRQYNLNDGRRVDTYVWAPKLQRTGEYGCSFLIRGIGDEKIRAAFGIDSMQAFVLALNTLLVHLCVSEEYKAGHLTWFDSPCLGLPVPKHLRGDTPEED